MAISWKQFVPQEILTSGDFQTYAVNNGMVQVDTAADLAGVDAAVHTCFVRNENPTGGVSVAIRAYRNAGWIRHIVADGRPDLFAPDACLPGSTYICTNPYTTGANGNYGAERWAYNGTRWICEVGNASVTHAQPAGQGTYNVGVTITGNGDALITVFDNTINAAPALTTATVPDGFRLEEGNGCPVYKYFGSEGQYVGLTTMRYNGVANAPTFARFYLTANPNAWCVGGVKTRLNSSSVRAWPRSTTAFNGWSFAAGARSIEMQRLEMLINAYESNPDGAERLEQLRAELEALAMERNESEG